MRQQSDPVDSSQSESEVHVPNFNRLATGYVPPSVDHGNQRTPPKTLQVTPTDMRAFARTRPFSPLIGFECKSEEL